MSRPPFRWIAGIALTTVAAAAALVTAGWIGIAASSGHWQSTSWLLHFAMRRSVAFHASAEPPQDLDDPARVRLGAAHYETGCAPCHGSPARAGLEAMRHMTPPPPPLAGRIDEWSDSELQWIVRHGVKYTGMPAWPAQSRADEAWSMAAFLRALPGLDADANRVLAFGELADPGAVTAGPEPAGLADCRRCHGLDGRGDPNGAFPRLDILDEATILTALEAYASGRRASGVMRNATRDHAPETLAALAAHYASVPASPILGRKSAFDADTLARGQAIAARGVPERNVAACSGCHEASRTGPFPTLQGQYVRHLRTQLALFATEMERGGGPFATLMAKSSHSLEPADIDAVSAWYASKVPKPE